MPEKPGVRPNRLPPLSLARSFRNLTKPVGQKLDKLFQEREIRTRQVHVVANSVSSLEDEDNTSSKEPSPTSTASANRHMSRMLNFASSVRPRLFSLAPSRMSSFTSSEKSVQPPPMLSSTSSHVRSFLSRRFDVIRAPSFMSVRHERRRQVDLTQTNDHNFWAMNIPSWRNSMRALGFEPVDIAAMATAPRIRGDPFYVSRIRYEQVKPNQEYYIMYQYRSVVDDHVAMAFQVGTCKMVFNYSRSGWIFMFVDVANVYDAMHVEDRAWLLPVVFINTCTSSVCDSLSVRDIALVMDGHPVALGTLRRYIWKTSSQHQYTDLENTQRRYNLTVFNKIT